MFKPVDIHVNFPELEKKILEGWYKDGIVGKYLHRNDASDKRFSFLDGPITANNPMGVHHAWGRTYKDLWQRFHAMRGYKERFQNGFDCQGLWVEVEVEKELGIRNKRDIENLVPGDKKASIAKFVELCRERVRKFSSIQTEQSKRLGYFMDWDNSYFTMSDENNYMIWHFLKTCHQKGWIYKGKDSVPWCPRCETAISQHEMLTEDYKELTHETVFLKLKVKNAHKNSDEFSGQAKLKIKVKDLYLLIWTTTPWTVPANVGVGVNVKYTYGIWERVGHDEAIIIIDKDDLGNIPVRTLKGKELPVPDYIFSGIEGEFKKVGTVSGKELLGLTYEAPFDHLPRVKEAQKEKPQTFHTVVDGSEIVTAAEGTGLLHVAPGAGKEDFDLGKKEKLPVISLIADDASYLDEMDEFSGKNAKKHPELIIDYLKQKDGGNYLLKTLHYTHRYPACWRCKAELVWKVADEWYIAMDKKEKGKGAVLREQMKKTANMIDWHPSFGLDRELDWLGNMHDWLISKKNRYWGLALPIYECTKCGAFDVIGSKDELKERAVEGWTEFEGKSPHKPFIDDVKITCTACGEAVSRIDDVGNVWLDAGIVPFSTLVDPETKQLSYTTDKTYWKQWFPVNFITESFPGQFKNWFYSMIAMSTVLEKRNPFETVLGYASMLGEDGRPMHKSWGNSIEFNEGADKIGVDVMRWMFATHEPEQNLLFGYKKADETRRRFHLMLWNIYNFFVTYATVDRWSSQKPDQAKKSHNVLDSWILSELNTVIGTVTASLESYQPAKAAIPIEEFVLDLSQWYVRRSRERVGPTVTNTEDKIQCYQTLYDILVTLSKLLAPFTPFMAEEIYRNLTGRESVHLADWPEVKSSLIDTNLGNEMKLARLIVEQGHAKRKLEGMKVRTPLALLSITAEGEFTNIRDEIWQIVLDELNIKNLKINNSISYPKKEVKVTAEELEKEGKARELIRTIQIKRKELGCNIAEKVKVILPDWPVEHTEDIKRETLAASLEKGPQLSVSKI